MNDFTKEELEDLLNCCYSGMHDDHPIEEYKLQLQVKLQSMIDNYCEHDWGVGFGSIHSPVIYCKKSFCQKPNLPDDVFKKVMGINKYDNQQL